MKHYSNFIKTVYDQQAPVGRLGRGIHYSVLRAPVATNLNLSPSDKLKLQDFAIIWDEDHDERVVAVIEHLIFCGLMSPIKFIGERKGMLEIIVDSEFYNLSNLDFLNSYKSKIENLTHKSADFWPVEIYSIDTYSQGHHIYKTFLDNIQNIHDLGIKENLDEYLQDYSKNFPGSL